MNAEAAIDRARDRDRDESVHALMDDAHRDEGPRDDRRDEQHVPMRHDELVEPTPDPARKAELARHLAALMERYPRPSVATESSTAS